MNRTLNTSRSPDEERAAGSSGEEVDEPVFQDQAQISTVNRAADNATPSGGLTGALLLAVFTAISGTAFQFGYASGVVNAPQTFIEDFINETYHRRNPNSYMQDSTVTFILSIIVSIFALGGMIGGLLGGVITDRFGRKGGMFLNNFVSAIACILMFISKFVHSYEILIVGRFILGLACGYGSSVAPTYINEVSPIKYRGTLGVAFQLGVVITLFLSQIISLQEILGGANYWNYAFGLPIIFSILQLILLIFVPESPKYLLLKRKNTIQAEDALRKLRHVFNVENEIAGIQEEAKSETKSASIADLFRTPTVRWALFIAVFLQLSQQFSGINAVIYYSKAIFQRTGLDDKTSEYANLGLGATIIIVTLISVFLIDRLGRRILHLTGLGGMFVACLILVISLLVPASTFWNRVSLIMTIAFVGLFSIGPGAIPWLITAELFDQTYRVPASSIAVLVNWSGNFVVGLGFKPLFTGFLKEYTFFLFVGLLVIFFLLTFFFVPETKAKTVETIYQEINRGQLWRRNRTSHQNYVAS